MKNYLIGALMMCTSVIGYAQTDTEKVKSTVSKEDIEGHIYFLASDELKGRGTGTPELDIAASYLANSLRRYGVKPAGDNGSYYQNVPMIETGTPDQVSLEIAGLNNGPFLYRSIHNSSFEGNAIFLGYGSKADFEKTDIKGKIVVVLGGTEKGQGMRAIYGAGREKKAMAEKAGAKGLVELVDVNAELWERYSHYLNEPRIKVGAEDESNENKFIHLMQRHPATEEAPFEIGAKMDAKLVISGIVNKKIPAKNVVGYLEGSDPELKDEFVAYTAHYDHVGVGKPNAEMDSIYNGARDNAVGTVTVLSAAENLAKYPTKRSSLFIFFTGEEKGLLGSKYFAENPTLSLDKIVYCWNSDNGGYNDTSKITIFGLYRTTVSEHIINAGKEFGLTVIDDPAPEQNLFDRSDNVSFAAKGVPAPTYSMGFNAFDDEIYKYYHQVTDNPDTLDYEYLYKFFQSYVLTARLIANDPVTPFWTEGDKYYEAGVELYKNKKDVSTVLD